MGCSSAESQRKGHERPPAGWIRLEPAPRRGEVDHELIWGLVALVLLAAGWALPFWRDHFVTVCPFHVITGYPCFLCGGTCALGLLTRGHWLAAWRMNPLGAVWGLATGIYMVYALMALLAGRRVRVAALGRVSFLRLLALAGLCAIVANWVYVIRAGR